MTNTMALVTDTSSGNIRHDTVCTKRMFVYVPFIKEGYHLYPGADKHPDLATGDMYDVSHLGVRHMHYFHFKVWVEVHHANRDIEFIQLRRWVESLYNSGALEMNGKSCEMLADDLAEQIHAKYPSSAIRIDVSEDGINGAYVEYEYTNAVLFGAATQ